MQIKILSYRTTDRAAVQAFVDISINDTWRVNGLHLMRDGTLQPAKLTPLIRGKRSYIDAIQVIDENLREQLMAAIRSAIQPHLKPLPPEHQVKPPQPPEPREMDQRPAAVRASAKPSPSAKPPQNAPTQAKTAPVALAVSTK